LGGNLVGKLGKPGIVFGFGLQLSKLCNGNQFFPTKGGVEAIPAVGLLGTISYSPEGSFPGWAWFLDIFRFLKVVVEDEKRWGARRGSNSGFAGPDMIVSKRSP
jgi:hypothetical protein